MRKLLCLIVIFLFFSTFSNALKVQISPKISDGIVTNALERNLLPKELDYIGIDTYQNKGDRIICGVAYPHKIIIHVNSACDFETTLKHEIAHVKFFSMPISQKKGICGHLSMNACSERYAAGLEKN